MLFFSGPRNSAGSLQTCLEKIGIRVMAYDIQNCPVCDITDDSIWGPLFARLQAGESSAAVIAPPCGTFTRLRSIPGGPPPLRGVAGKDRYGFIGLSNPRSEQVRVANLLALRAIKSFWVLIRCGGAVVLEQLALIKSEVSMLRLDEAVQLLEALGVEHTVMAQCPFGAPSQKLSSFVTLGMSFQGAARTCTHVARTWFREVAGEAITAKEVPTRGAALYFSCMDGPRRVEAAKEGDYVSTSLAAYTPVMNPFIVAKLRIAMSQRRVTSVPASSEGHPWNARLGREKVIMSQSLRGILLSDEKGHSGPISCWGTLQRC